MKKFLKKRWRGIPVGIISAVLVVCLLAGGVLAVYNWWAGTAVVTVDEAITYHVTGGDGSFDAETSVWTVSIMAGEEKVLYLTVSNASSADLEVVATVDPISTSGLTVTGNDGIPLAEPVIIPGGTSGPFAIEVHADTDVVPGTYTFQFFLGRC